MNKKLGKKKKGANSPKKLLPPTLSPTPPQVSIPELRSRRSRLILVAEILGGVIALLAGAATIGAGTGYAIEKWQETTATVDFSGDVDEKRPLTLPLLAKNPSGIFAMYEPRMQCSVNAEYDDGSPAHHAAIFADQLPVPTPTIPPGRTGTYFCDAPQMGTLADTKTGAVVPMKQAEMTVTLNYKTRMPFLIQRTVVSQFAVFATSSGYRWVKGSWLGGHPMVQRPPDLEKYPPLFTTGPKQ